MTILVVDDELPIIELIQYNLKKEGFTGCKTIFDIPPAYLCSMSEEDLRAHLL